jgi:CCR4-NOT transcription complex subunit 3
MAANRKLLSEIQQVLKKYEEGVLLFDDIWDKVYAAGQQSLKEKYESDLKKEIKKLQRLRDQIKTWIGSAEVKDKAQLLEARKVIETKMEQFKICEKDTKTKAYSKEGLARDSKVDPKEAMREEKRNWINDCLERLNDIIHSVDADKEKLLSAKGNKAKNKEQIEKFDNRIQKNKWHINKLEAIIKLLDNEDLDPSALDSLKESLEYYLETAVEDDGAVGVEDEFGRFSY